MRTPSCGERTCHTKNANKKGGHNMSKRMITREGMEKAQQELQYLRTEKRKLTVDALREAREHGDLSENAEYEAALEELRRIEERISELEQLLASAIVAETTPETEKVSVGCRVNIHNVEHKIDFNLTIVGSSEGRSLERKLSIESPVGKALVGKKIGDEVQVKVRDTVLTYRVLEVIPA